ACGGCRSRAGHRTVHCVRPDSVRSPAFHQNRPSPSGPPGRSRGAYRSSRGRGMTGRRRANGEGTIVRRAGGRFHAAYYVLTPDGHRERRYVYGRTWDECHGKLVDMKAKTAKGIPLAVKAWTVERYLRFWLAEVAGPRLRPTTVSGYDAVVRVH